VTLALLCSGQGRQDPAMFDLFADAPAAMMRLGMPTGRARSCASRAVWQPPPASHPMRR
jgi:hypothetical protein